MNKLNTKMILMTARFGAPPLTARFLVHSVQCTRTLYVPFLPISVYAISMHRRSVTGAWGGPGPPDFLKITITQTSRSAVYNKGKSEIGENSVYKTFHKTFI